MRTARELEPRALIAVYQPHVYERTRQLHHELGEALGLADGAIVTDVIEGRDAPLPGVTGKLVLDDVPAPTRRGWAPTLEDASALALAWARPGDVVVTLGVGEPWRIARAVVEGLARVTRIEHDVPLARLTTIGVGGPARALARPRSVAELVEALRFARDEELAVLPVGLGSNLLASDDGVDALVLKLEGELAAVEVDGDVLRAGAGATNAVCLHRARDAGLGGFEFACAIPGTAGGGVVMNAGAYGRDWADILVRALVATADGERWLSVDELGLSLSALVTRNPAPSSRGSSTGSSPDRPPRSRPRLRSWSRGARPRSRRTSERSGASSRTPTASSARGGCSSCAASRATGSAARSSRRSTRTSSRTPTPRRVPTASRCMVEARRRAHEEFGVVLEREVVFAALPELPPTT